MRAQHVIIGRDNADIWRAASFHRRLILKRAGKSVGEVGTGYRTAFWRAICLTIHQVEICLSAVARFFDHALRHLGDDRIEITHAN